MTTISRNRRSRLPLSRLAKFGALALILAAALFWRAALSGLLWRALAPVAAWRDSLDATQNAALRAELASTTAALADRDALYAENAALKAQLGRSAAAPRLAALVLERPPGIPYDTLIIDAGQNLGVAAGDAVYAGGTTLIGQVTEAYATTARVTLLSAPGQSYQALIRGTVPVSMAGQGAGSLKGEVPAQTQVGVGDPVLFADIAGGYTGSVSHVDAPEGESFEVVYVALPVDLFSLRYVFVQTKSL